jgi:UDP-N-acetylmuramate--alanine ligase
MTHFHLIGIGGTGLSAIAKVLLERGETVSGSDRSESALAQSVRAAGGVVYIGHHAGNIADAEVVIRSSAIPDDNPEVVAALAAGLPVLKRVDFLGDLLAEQQVIAVAGSHGKTSTTAMLAWLLSAINAEPGFIAGGMVRDLDTNASAGAGEHFVIEADEYDYMFWGLNPQVAVVTNVEHDHPDLFPTAESFTAAFEGFVDRIKPGGWLVACLDDSGARELIRYAREKGVQVRTYSLGDNQAYILARNIDANPGAGYAFDVHRDGEFWINARLDVPGMHNVQNALGALLALHLLGFDAAEAADHLPEFSGARRRFEIRGEARGVLVVDDYGHHPTEIRATLAAARARYPAHRIWAVWQPHTWSRSQQLRREFSEAFGDADRVLVTPVYASRETQPEGYNHAAFVAGIDHDDVRLIDSLDEAAETLVIETRPRDVVITFSAGDATQISQALLAGLRNGELAQ